MKLSLFSTLRNYRKEYLLKDIFSGIIIAAVSIPISMGYAQISGIPAVYGLYGSVLPILLFALFSTSRQFIFGVDAAPAAIVGGALSTLGIAAESDAAMNYVPAISLFAGLWLFLFFLLHADRIVDFISTPVMGGFISGIAVTIILMQIPKLMGSPAGSGELLELAEHIFAAAKNISWLSLGMGLGALILIRLFKKLAPKFPMAIVIMALGVLATVVFHVDEKGVVLLQSVERGLPALMIPDLINVDLTQAAGRGLMVAVVIMAETLLAENTFAFRNDYKLNDRQEILACAAGNVAAAAVGCCPVNGSISRTSLNEQYGGKSQAVSITAGITHGSDSSVLYRLYRLSSCSCADCHCNLCSDGCCGNTPCCPPFQSEQNRILYFHGCRLQRPLPGYHLRCYHRYPALFCCSDHQGYQSATLLPRYDSGKRCIL